MKMFWMRVFWSYQKCSIIGWLKITTWLVTTWLDENNNMVCSPVKGVVKLGMISKDFKTHVIMPQSTSKDFKTHVIMPQSTSIKPLVYISSKMLEIGVGRRVNKGQILLPGETNLVEHINQNVFDKFCNYFIRTYSSEQFHQNIFIWTYSPKCIW